MSETITSNPLIELYNRIEVLKKRHNLCQAADAYWNADDIVMEYKRYPDKFKGCNRAYEAQEYIKRVRRIQSMIEWKITKAKIEFNRLQDLQDIRNGQRIKI